MNYINRFFNEKVADIGAKIMTPEQAIVNINSAVSKVEKLCFVKGQEGAPLQALQELSLLKTKIDTISQGINKSQNTLENKSVLTSSI